MLHQHQWRPQLDADAIPLLSATDELPLLHRQADDDDDGDAAADVDSVTSSNASSRRKKRYSGAGELSSSSGMARFVRRRGRSASVPTATAVTPSALRADDDERQFIRTRAGSAGAAFGASAATASARRRATSSLLSRFRRRKDMDGDEQQQQQSRHAKSKRRVHFKTSLYPEVVPDPRAHVPSYDELLFSVGGLYQTLSFLHDPLPPPDDARSTESSGSALLLDDAPPPPERSMQLMIAEFLFRSAVYLGYADSGTPWIPGFRDAKRYSVNDVKRWRRLAHHDWEREEQQLEQQQLQAAAAAATAQRRKSSASPSRLRAAVTGWLQRRRRHSAPARLAMNHPPPVPAAADLSLLVAVANSCVSYGAFRLTARDIRLLCNIDIDSQPALGAA